MIFKIAMRNIFHNKKRTMMTILPIMLSSMLMFFFVFLYSTYQKSQLDQVIYDIGNHHLTLYNEPYSALSSYKNYEDIKSIYPVLEEEIIEQTPNYIINRSLYKADKEYLNTLELTSGRLPNNEQEVVIPETVCLKVGQTVKTEDIEYHVVGCVKQNHYYTFHQFEQEEPVNYLVTYKEMSNIQNKTESIFQAHIKKNVEYNDKYLQFFHAGVGEGYIYSNALSILIVLIGSTFIGIFVLFVVYNAYTISIVERKKMYGVLTTVGASRKDIVLSIFIETFVHFIVAIVFAFLFTYFIIEGYIQYINIHYFTNFHFYIFPSLFLISFIILLVFVLLSSIMPAIEASYIDPIVAIQENKDIKIKKVKEPKLINKLFGIEGALAYKNSKRNRRKSGVTTFSIVVSFTFFVVISIFVENIGNMEDDYFSQNYDFKIEYNGENLGEFIDKLDDNTIIQKNVMRFLSMGAYTPFKEESLTDLPDFLKNDLTANGKEYIYRGVSIYNILNDYSDISITKPTFINFTQYIDEENILHKSSIFKEEIPPFSVCHTEYNFDKKQTEIKDCLKLENMDSITKVPTGVYTSNRLMQILVDDATFEMLAKEDSPYVIYLKVKDVNKFESFLLELKKEYDFAVTNQYKAQVEENLSIYITTLLSKGIILFASLFAIINIYNSITISMSLRKKEFKMLASLGMDEKSFRRMIRFESFFFSLKSIIWGIILSSSIYFWLRMVWKELFTVQSILDAEAKFHFPLPMKYILLAVIILVMVVYVVMMLSSRQKEEDIIISMMEEN